MLSQMREYPKLVSKDLRMLVSRTQDGLTSQLWVIQTPFGYRRVAEMFKPEADGSYAAILYVHWYEPESISSHRSQFEEEAKELAQSGAVCISLETLWSDRDFFLKRTQEDDAQNSVEEVVNIRRAMDLLLSQPNVDSKRFAFVGHDFGGMYGVLAGSLDKRPTHYVLMAATPHFPDWYLYLPKLEGSPGKRLSVRCQKSTQLSMFRIWRRLRCFSNLPQTISMFRKNARKISLVAQRIQKK